MSEIAIVLGVLAIAISAVTIRQQTRLGRQLDRAEKQIDDEIERLKRKGF